jgi:hypothetical protein
LNLESADADCSVECTCPKWKSFSEVTENEIAVDVTFASDV